MATFKTQNRKLEQTLWALGVHHLSWHKTEDGMTEWETATIPLTDFPNFVGQTYGFILKNTIAGVNGEYACQGMLAFYNDECDGKPAREMTDFVVYWNNFRVVPMTTIDLEEDE